VRREASRDDGRSVRVGLTAEGRRLAGEVAAEVALLTGGLNAVERKRLAALPARVLA
jgi:MarR family transcriptional regulator, lower aerobic nicotinate degradation pathway regulator